MDDLVTKYNLIYSLIKQSPEEYFFVFVIAAMIPMFIWLGFSRYKSTLLIFVFNFPGTILHELLHFSVGIVTLARPVSFSIVPKRSEDGGWTLGSVGFMGLNQLNALPTAMAPILAPLIILIFIPDLFSYMASDSTGVWWKSLLISFFIVSGFMSCIPSSVDFRMAFDYKVGLLFYSIIVGLSIEYFLLGQQSVVYGLIN